MADVPQQLHNRLSRQVQVATFYLLWCEDCGLAREPSPPAPQPDFVAPQPEAMRCSECGRFLLLIECFTAAQTKLWQARPGAAWRIVIYPDDLPKARWPERRAGRQRWIDP
jgi:hypothetical protein